jgi:ubiquinone/menaquinone biosynthesis C-methylase UbiE
VIRPVAKSYDRIMRGMEEAGLSAWRDELLSPLFGTVVEIGAGTGRSIASYPGAVTSLTLAEPDKNMRAQLRRAVEASGKDVHIIDSPAESLPCADASIDFVVSSLVLCSVKDQSTVLTEVRRVLRPEGRLVFVEHVAANDNPRRRKWQGRLELPWRAIAGDCHLTRDTEASIVASGFELVTIERSSLRAAPPFLRPSIRGSATPLA